MSEFTEAMEEFEGALSKLQCTLFLEREGERLSDSLCRLEEELKQFKNKEKI
jgi:hypothetical protein